MKRALSLASLFLSTVAASGASAISKPAPGAAAQVAQPGGLGLPKLVALVVIVLVAFVCGAWWFRSRRKRDGAP